MLLSDLLVLQLELENLKLTFQGVHDMYFIKLLSPKAHYLVLEFRQWESLLWSQLHQCLPDPSIMHSVCIKEDQVSQTISFLISQHRVENKCKCKLKHISNLNPQRRKASFIYLLRLAGQRDLK